ncbi:MAG: AI-2E family transporter [Clostridia bacterium]|nr:AI-2E family transporter [Clostridia bacterium]
MGNIFASVWSVISPVVLGMCIAFVMNVGLVPVERILARLTRKKLKGGALRAVSILITVLILLGFIVFVVGVIVPSVGESIGQLASYLPGSADDMQDWLSASMGRIGVSEDSIAKLMAYIDSIVDELIAFIQREYMEIANIAVGVATSILDVAMGLVISLIFAIYILSSKEYLQKLCSDALRRFVREERCSRIMEICRMSNDSFASFVKGQLLEAVILGVLCFIGMVIFRFPNAPVVSLLVGVTALVPIFGAWIGGGISALLIAIVNPMQGLLFIVFILVLQQLEGNLIYPKVVGQSMGLPGLIVMAAVTIGGNIAGIAGMLLGVPTCAVLYALLQQAVYGKNDMEKTA